MSEDVALVGPVDALRPAGAERRSGSCCRG